MSEIIGMLSDKDTVEHTFKFGSVCQIPALQCKAIIFKPPSCLQDKSGNNTCCQNGQQHVERSKCSMV